MKSNLKESEGRISNSGQAVIFIVMAICILVFAMLFMVDVHRIIFIKDRSQNAGDAAALAGARWQASSINFIGELNLMHALASSLGDEASVDVITNTQMRVCFVGPMTGVAAAQQAAKLNGIHVNEEFTSFMKEHADKIENGYASIMNGSTALPEPWLGAWEEYADMVNAIADEGVAAGVDNAILYTDPMGAHPLLQIEFYEAIRGKNWCWFHFYGVHLLEEYDGYTWWPALPEQEEIVLTSPEFLPLYLKPSEQKLSSVAGDGDASIKEAEVQGIELVPQKSHVNEKLENWYYYNSARWGSWDTMLDPAFPIEGEVRDEYNYQGADSVMRVEANSHRLMEDAKSHDTIVWTGAAKPFGYLENEDGKTIPNAVGLVLPAFHTVNLIPIDASSAPNGGSFNMKWRRHREYHLPVYLAEGPSVLSSNCKYCRQLVTWEFPDFRASGVEWLSSNSWKCVISPPGGGSSGGTRHAH
ncbi:MAG: hypothetical protein J6V41_07695 [Kiritimatiellae bacterium]|nr:hypothetical protein [Kiritimatiellia bacterium]